MLSSILQNGNLIHSSISNGELVAAYIGRHRHSGLSPLQRRLWKSFGKTNEGSITWLLPTHLHFIAEQFGEFVGSAESLLNNNTLFPAFKRFLSPTDITRLRNHHLFDCLPGIASTVGISGMGNRANGWKIASCEKCLKEDIAVDGRPFWRRDFVMPGIDYCGRHGEPLSTFCPICHPLSPGPKAMSYPRSKCACQTHKVTLQGHLTAREIGNKIDTARAFSRLLNVDLLPHMCRDSLTSLIQLRASTLGLTVDGQVNWSRVCDFFQQKYSESTVGMQFTGLGIKQIRHVFIGTASIRNPIQNILLLRFLYGTWDAAEKALDMHGSEGRPVTISQAGNKDVHRKPRPKNSYYCMTTPEKDAVFHASVSIYRQARSKYPGLCHTALLFLMPHTAKQVLTRERLKNAGEDMPAEHFGSDYYLELDRSMASHIRDMYMCIISADYKNRLSRNLLLKGHRMASVWSRIEHRLPAAKDALAECEESFAQFRRRTLRELVKDGKVSSISPAELALIDSLDDGTVSKLLKRARA